MPKHTQNSLTWFPYDVGRQQSTTMAMSLAARGLDQVLTDHAWSAPDGSCSVDAATLHSLCKRESLDPKDLYEQLIASKRWVRSEDKKSLIAPWLREIRQRADLTIEHRRKAGIASGKKRQAQATPRTKRPYTKRTPAPAQSGIEHVFNTCSPVVDAFAEYSRNGPQIEAAKSLSDNAVNTCSAHDEQRTGCCTSSLPTVEKEVQQQPANECSSAGATSPAASHAGGAAALVAESPPTTTAEPPPRVVPDWRAILCETQIADTAIPAGWVSADLAEVVHTLEAAETGVDVQRALYRLCSKHQRVPGDDGHLPLLDEIRAILDGAGGRDGLIDREAASVAVALALHGANAVPNLVAPLLLRSIATATLRELQRAPTGAEPRRIAAGVAYEFTKGRRKTSGYTLPCDAPAAPERLFGHRVKEGVAA